MRQSLLLLAAAASAQTRITNWEEQHQRFVRQAAFEDLLSWFRQRKEPNLKLGWLHGNETCVDRHESCGPWSALGECKNNPTWMRANCPVSCGVVSGCTSGKPKILVEDVSTETWTAVKAVVGDLLLALRGDEVLFVREVDGPADLSLIHI